MQKAKKVGKLRADYRIPEEFKNNFPHVIEEKLKIFKQQGFFQRFPFGTDFTDEEQVIGRALKVLKNKSRSKKLMLKLLLRALIPQRIPAEYEPYLKRMGLWEVKGLEERLLRKLLVLEIKQFK